MLKEIFFLGLFIFFIHSLLGCATSSKQDGSKEKNIQQKPVAFLFESKIFIKDLKKKKNFQVKMDLMVFRREYLRMDITATLGLHLASLAYQKNQIEYLVTNDKKFFFGKATQRSFYPLLKMNLHPLELFDVIYQRPMRSDFWECDIDKNQIPLLCYRRDQKIKIRWLQGEKEQDTILILSEDFEIRWFLPNNPEEVQFQAELFKLKKPDGFKKIQLQ